MDTAEARAAVFGAANSGFLKIADLKRFAEFRQLEWAKLWSVN